MLGDTKVTPDEKFDTYRQYLEAMGASEAYILEVERRERELAEINNNKKKFLHPENEVVFTPKNSF